MKRYPDNRCSHIYSESSSDMSGSWHGECLSATCRELRDVAVCLEQGVLR